MPKTLFKVDLTKPMDQQEMPGHNRWHPDIPAVASVNPGDVFRIECKDWTDGQIKDNDDPKDIETVNLEVVHVLSGPIWVNGAEPGDILVVDLLDVGALLDAQQHVVGLGIVPAGSMSSVNSVLNAAAWTYVAGTLQSVLTLLYYASYLTGGSSSDSDR